MASEEKFIVVESNSTYISQYFPVGALVKKHNENVWINLRTNMLVEIQFNGISVYPLPQTPEEIEIFSMLHPHVKLVHSVIEEVFQI